MTTPSSAKRGKATRDDARDRVALAAIGLEAEFAIVVDGHPAKPEDVFGSPTQIVRAPMMHRTGRSYHLPTGGAVYFDTGVIEIATPVVEIRRGCAARAGRSLWESIAFLRTELDAWEERENHSVQLSGFSTHYNVSFDTPTHGGRTVDMLAMLLTHIIPMPVMLLAANRRSTGIGVRPRSNRIEVTADFTPDAALMIAAATVIVGIAREVMTWPSFALDELDSHDIPVIDDFVPEPHSSRNGWVARFTSYAADFAAEYCAHDRHLFPRVVAPSDELHPQVTSDPFSELLVIGRREARIADADLRWVHELPVVGGQLVAVEAGRAARLETQPL